MGFYKSFWWITLIHPAEFSLDDTKIMVSLPSVIDNKCLYLIENINCFNKSLGNKNQRV